MWQLDEVIRAVEGTALHTAQGSFTGISTDSRTIQEGELFVPLKGPRFDGHAFIGEAFLRGAAGSLCDKGRESELRGAAGTVILVADANEALLDLARDRRARIGATFIALTGSNGKTTTKELLARMMETTFPVAYNQRNYNNRIGVSQTLLGIESDPAFFIMELGTNHKGEIAELAALVKPDMSLITNVNPSHLQGLGDLDGVYREKTDLFRATKEGGAIFINKDDPLLACYKPESRIHTHRFSMLTKAESTLDILEDKGLLGFDISLKLGKETVTTSTPLLGRHNLANILAAAAVAHQSGAGADNIGKAIEGFQPYAGRFRSMESTRGYTVIDDTYNANPASMEKAVATLVGLPCKGKKIVILGDMKELGEETAYYHRELGRMLAKADIPLTLLLGDQIRVVQDEVKNGRVFFFQESSALLRHALEAAEKDDIILVKGSRALRMDDIVEGLL
ncbi:MAG TPA: UDP-N-acetylmuramoyl-tripeptide--D-alanyl-D-alanine ligase [Deltaproteobacteria bacterium]|nr:UDP-N-acetylmuramoyl-tripeptide--D-alanyl-D-alanine ligase [Deltaproteobacteria bacterium]